MRFAAVLSLAGLILPAAFAACSSDPDPAGPAANPDSGKTDDTGAQQNEDSGPSTDAGNKDASDAPPTFPAGEIDTTFGDKGIGQVLPASFAWQPQSGIVLADDRIVVVGVGNDSTGNHDIVIGRFDAEGAAAPNPQTSSFKYATHAGWDVDLSSVVESPAGSLVYFGRATMNSEFHGFLEQHDVATGTCNWGTDCWTFSIPQAASQTHAQVISVVVGASGDLLVGGAGLNGSSVDFMLSKVDANGNPIASYGGGAGTNGTVSTDFGNTEAITFLAPQKDTKVLAVGSKGIGANASVVMARYTAAGALDTTFGTAGKVQTGKKADIVVSQADGKLLGVTQDLGSGSPKTAFTRFLATGETDPSFGVDGVLLADWPTGENAVAAVAIQADGHILVGYKGFTIARFSGGGVLDKSWGKDGYVAFPDLGKLAAIGFQKSGKVIAMGGQTKAGGSTEMMAVVRLHP